MGNLGGFIAPIVTGYILDATGSWALVFSLSSAVYVLGALSWILLDPVTPLDRPGPPDSARGTRSSPG
jgi:MFS transporter, ACS family, glucarate transporter